MKVLIAGAHGLTGQQLVSKLAQHNHEVAGIIRPGKADHRKDLLRLGIHRLVELDLAGDTLDKLDKEIGDCDAFVFAAGAASKLSNPQATPQQTTAIDKNAAMRTADMCARHNVPFYMLSAIGADDPEAGEMSSSLRHYMRCKHDADKHLVKLGRENGLKFVIVRAGVLTDKTGLGFIVAKENAHRGDFGHESSISRADVADTFVHLIEHGDKYSGRVIGIVGGTEKIGHALERIVQPAVAEA